MTSSTDDPKYIHCNECFRQTRHRLVHSERFDNTETVDASWTIHSEVTYSMYECGGCKAVLVESVHIGDDTNGEAIVEYLPPREYRRKPAWLRKFRWAALSGNPKLPLLNEIYSALSVDSLRLAALGLRALLEHVMLEKNGGDQGTFAQNLARFMETGDISANQRDALAQVLDWGSAVMHRSHTPSREQVVAALDVVEGVMQAIYSDIGELQKAMKDLPPRRPRAK